MIKVCIAGATGWVGRDLVQAVTGAVDLRLVGAVARSAAGQDAGVAAGLAPVGLPIAESVADALVAAADVLIDYTKPDAVKRHALTAIGVGVNVVIGTSGLTADDYAEIDAAARKAGVGVIAAGNYSLTAALLQRFALMAVPLIPDVEVIDYAYEGKPDVPSGTARELAERLGQARTAKPTALATASLRGPHETRGAAIATVPVHSLRLPGYVLSCEAQFGMPGERLTIRHDAGSGAGPYVAGTLLAVRKVVGRVGLTRGLDTLMFGDAG
jgi:4-hydroxy-tetrahydrodipicolinate reductase